MSYTQPNVRAATELWTHADYTATLDKARDRATVRIEKTPAAGREAWKTKLFVHTGIMLMEGKKYRISMDVKSIIPAPFEICFNNGDTEKGLGAMYGLISTPSGQHATYTLRSVWMPGRTCCITKDMRSQNSASMSLQRSPSLIFPAPTRTM